MKKRIERSFEDVVNKIIAVGNKGINAKIEVSMPYWVPEARWTQLDRCINRFMPKDSKDPTSVKIYAILCDCTEKQMRKRFKKEGY